MTRKRRGQRGRRANPTRNQWIGGAIVVGATAAIAYAIHENETGAPAPSGPRGPRPSPYPMPPLPPPDQVGQGTLGPDDCDLGPSYPGFEWDGVDCAPSPATPPGIYIIDECSDFIFVAGDDGAQPLDLDARIVAASKMPSPDPTAVVTNFLSSFWPSCTWPPAPDAGDRVVQLYMALSVMVGREVIARGGTVLGTTDSDTADELLGDRFTELGYDMFRPEIVPEIELPDLDQHSPGHFPADPGPKGPGLIDLGPSGPFSPPPHQAPVLPPGCSLIPYDGSIETFLDKVKWTERKVKRIAIFTPDSTKCDAYEITFGLCMVALQGTYGWLDQIGGAAATTLFQIRDSNGEILANYNAFRRPVLWKRQYKISITYANGKVMLQPGGLLSHVDDGSVDPCPGKSQRFPVGPYSIQPTDSDGFRSWNPQPLVSALVQGKTLSIEIDYTGLVQFVRVGGSFGGHPQDYGRARMDLSNSYLVSTKVHAIGTAG